MTYKEAAARFRQTKPDFSDEYKKLLKAYGDSKNKKGRYYRLTFTQLMETYHQSKNMIRPGEQ